eukprot:CAMPEP_0119015266 /NCGR_PEP_ID=MMETSP1176-20130426/10718_1 /TAXON_ID=265551 /ORGANISM="Synedropsis recta cf, Strain CCMP1620" /LENGTH=214 /DNA_ID=CAMNT_0006968545 /DNA_START=61 /DNA_END=705 /DNA_ORIENTATION=+
MMATFFRFLIVASVTITSSSLPVKVRVCTEALCSDCKNFVHKTLIPVYSQLGPDVMDLQLVPFGNAHLQRDGSVKCQHGVGECDANAYELCAIQASPNAKDYLPFIGCLAETLPMGRSNEPLDQQLFQQCAESNNLWWSRIQACHDIPQAIGNLVKKAASETPADHTSVPWIEIEGDHMDEEKLDFKTEVCKAFVAGGGSHRACDGVLGTTQFG